MAYSNTNALAVFCERELGHNLSGSSSQRSDIVSHLDRAHKIVLAGGGILNYTIEGKRLRENVVFPFARSQYPKVITLASNITPVLVTATRASNAITLNAAPSVANVNGYFIRINAEPELYRIAAHANAATSATLDGDYVGPDNVSAGNCVIFPLQYTVGSNDILQIISPIRCFSSTNDARSIDLVDKDELLKNLPLSKVQNEFPKQAAVIRESNANVTLQFASFPDDYARVEVDYIPVPTALAVDSVNPIIPEQYCLTIAYLACYLMANRNNDNRAPNFLQQARMEFMQLVNWSDQLMSAGDPDKGRVKLSGMSGGKKIATIKSWLT